MDALDDPYALFIGFFFFKTPNALQSGPEGVVDTMLFMFWLCNVLFQLLMICHIFTSHYLLLMQLL